MSGQIPLNAALKVELKEAHPNDGTVPLPRRLGLTARAIPVGAGPPGLRRSRVRLGRPRVAVGGGLVLSRVGGRLLLRLEGTEGNARVNGRGSRLATATLRFPFILCPRLADRLPLHVRGCVGATARQRFDMILYPADGQG